MYLFMLSIPSYSIRLCLFCPPPPHHSPGHLLRLTSLDPAWHSALLAVMAGSVRPQVINLLSRATCFLKNNGQHRFPPRTYLHRQILQYLFVPTHKCMSAVLEMAAGCGNIAPGDSASSSGASSANKRKQPDSVVTFPAQPAKRRGGGPLPGAGWIRGEADRARTNSTRSWRARGGSWPRAGVGLRRGWTGRGYRGRKRRPW